MYTGEVCKRYPISDPSPITSVTWSSAGFLASCNAKGELIVRK